jgi:hypothetical protein
VNVLLELLMSKFGFLLWARFFGDECGIVTLDRVAGTFILKKQPEWELDCERKPTGKIKHDTTC